MHLILNSSFYISLCLLDIPMNNKNAFTVGAISISLLLLIGVIGPFTPLHANGQLQTTGKKPLPVLLIHGYAEDATIWKKWEELLKKDGIQVFTIAFKDSDDKCGSAAEHAKELEKRVQDVKKQTGSDKVNIVGHSKGGLDARVYLAKGTADVANLIMIGTPNNGSPLADLSNICKPAVDDLRPGANATKAVMNKNTKYYTITGDWLPAVQGNPAIPGHDDGLVPVSSVESEGYFKNLGRTGHGHAELLQEQEYNMAKDVLLGKK
jgi:pimeloyl-ACP methyl ester carboxylesterase